MLNLIQKLHALMVSKEVNVWHFPCCRDGKPFAYWLTSEPENKEGHRFDTLEEMIEAAYAHIDPQREELPVACPVPHQAVS